MFRYLVPALLLCVSVVDQENPAPTQAPSTPASPQPSSQASATAEPKLRVKNVVRATYPSKALEDGIEGQVVLRVLVSESGDVENVDVVSGDKGLTEAAVDAVKKWTFEPYLVDGKPAKVRTTLPIDFKLPEEAQGLRYDAPKVAPSTNADGTPGVVTRVRVSSRVAQGMIQKSVEPIYPPLARANHVQGTVILHAIISKEGQIEQLRLVAGSPDLARAAITAVAQWRYRPFLLQGEPVEVDSQIEVRFTLH